MNTRTKNTLKTLGFQGVFYALLRSFSPTATQIATQLRVSFRRPTDLVAQRKKRALAVSFILGRGRQIPNVFSYHKLLLLLRKSNSHTASLIAPDSI